MFSEECDEPSSGVNMSDWSPAPPSPIPTGCAPSQNQVAPKAKAKAKGNKTAQPKKGIEGKACSEDKSSEERKIFR